MEKRNWEDPVLGDAHWLRKTVLAYKNPPGVTQSHEPVVWQFVGITPPICLSPQQLFTACTLLILNQHLPSVMNCKHKEHFQSNATLPPGR